MTTPVGSIKLDLTIDGLGLPAEVLASVHKAIEPTLKKLNRDLDALQRKLGETGREGERSASKQAVANRGLAEAVERVGQEQERAAAKTAAGAGLSTRSINAVTRALEKQTAALAANTAARSANAAAPIGGGPPPSARGGGSGGRGGGGRGGIGGFLTSPLGLNGIALGASALPAATTAVVNLTGAVQALGQAGLVVPGIFAGIGASFATSIVGLHGMTDAVGALSEAMKTGDPKDLEKAQELLKDMAPAAVDLATSLATLNNGPLKELRKNTSQRLLGGVAKEFDDFAAKQVPRVEAGMGKVADAQNGAIKELLRVGGSDSTGSFIDRIFGNTAEAQTRATKAIEPLVHGFGTLATTGTSFLPRLADGVGRLATRFDTFITAADGDGRLAKWIDEGFKAAANFGESLLNIGKIITDITGAAGGDGGFLKWLRDTTGALRDFTSSDEGQAKLKQFFADGKAKLDEWLPVLKNAVILGGQVVQGFQQWGDIILPVIGKILETLNQLGGDGGAIASVVTALLAIKTTKGIAGLLTDLGKIKALTPGGAPGVPVGAVGVRGALGTALSVPGLALAADAGVVAYNASKDIQAGGSVLRGRTGQREGTDRLGRSRDPFGQNDPANNAKPLVPAAIDAFKGAVDTVVSGNVEAVTAKLNAAKDAAVGLAQYIKAIPPVQISDNSAEVQANVDKLKAALANIPPGSANIVVQYTYNGQPISLDQLRTPIRVAATPGGTAPTVGGGRAAGGVIPGYSPGVDNVLYPLSGGEGILIPEAVRALGGSQGIYAINSRFRAGLSRQGYADGGVHLGSGALPGPVPPGDPVLALLTQIRDLLAGKGGGGPLVDTAQGVDTIANSGGGALLAGGKTAAFDPVKGAMQGALSALGFPQQLIDQWTGGATGAAGGIAGSAGAPGVVDKSKFASALAAFAQSGSLGDVTGLGLDANDSVVKAIATARNKKKNGLGGDAIAGLVDQVLTGGGFTGTLDSTNTPLVTALQSFSEKLAKGKVPGATLVPPGMAMLPASSALGSKSGLQPAASQLFDLIATQFPQVRQIGGVRDDPIPDHPSGRALDIMVGKDQALGDQINAYLRANAAALGIDSTIWRDKWADFQGNTSTVAGHQDHIHAKTVAGDFAAGVGGLLPTDPAGVAAGSSIGAGGVQSVFVTNWPGQPVTGGPGAPGGLGGPAGPGGATNYPGKSIVDAATQGVGGVGSDVAGSLIDAILSGTDFKTGTPTGPGTTLDGLLKERNPLAAASAFGFNVPDYTRQGGEGAVENDPNAPSFDAKGRMFSDTGTLIDRTMTDLQTQMKAQFDQTLAVFDQIKNRLGEDVLKPVVQTAVADGIKGLGDQFTSQIGTQLGQTAGPIIANAVKSAIPAGAGAPVGNSASGGGQFVMPLPQLFAAGGGISGGTPGKDSVPAFLMPGEHVFTTADVARMGGQAGVYQFRKALAAGQVQGFATGGGVIGNDTVGADFFGISQVPIIGAIVNLLVKVLLKMIGVDIEVRDTLDEMSDSVRQFRGDFQKFDATGRLMNDTSGLIDRSSTSEQEAADERIRILKKVIEGIIKFIIEKVIVPIGKAIANALIQAAGTAASGAITGAGGGPAGGIVGAAISSLGTALVDIGGDLFVNFANALVPVLIDGITEGLQSFFPDILTTIFGGGLMETLLSPFTGLLDTITNLFGGGLGGIFGGLLGGLPFDQGGVANGVGLMPKATIRPERVLNPRQTDAFERALGRDFGDGGGTSRTLNVTQTIVAGPDQTPHQAADQLLSLLGAN